MEIFEVPLIDDDLLKLIARFAINLVFVLLVVVVAYHPNQRKKSNVFTYLMMNVMVFFICFALKKLSLDLGMALGLFAIFAIIRYRTDAIKIKDMTYLFIVIGLAVINALSNKQTSYAELLFVNLAIFGSTTLLENLCKVSSESKLTMIYDNADLLKPEHREKLIADLRAKTGLDVVRVEVSRIDLNKNSGTITVFYQEND